MEKRRIFRYARFQTLFLLLGIISLVLTGCGGGGEGGGDDINNHETSDFEEVTIGPAGGNFSLSNGLKLSVPPDAVTEETIFQFRPIGEGEIELPSTIFRQFEKSYVTGFEAKPSGYNFAKPIQVTFTSPPLIKSTSLVYPLTARTVAIESRAFAVTEAGSSPPIINYLVDLSTITVNDDGTINLPDLSSLPKDQQAIILLEIEKLRKPECDVQPCRCGAILIESSDFDSASNANDGCYSVYSDGFVQYLDCDYDPIEPWSLHETNLDILVTPTNETIPVGEIVYFSFELTDENGQPVTNFSIEKLAIEKPSVITDVNIGNDSIGIKGVSPGISSSEVTIESGGCQYKAWFTVEVNPIQIIAADPVSIPEGNHTGIGVKLSDSPPVAQTVMLTALVAGDSDISVVSGQTMTFDASNWDTEQYMIVEAAEDDLDEVNGDAIITILADHDFYEAAIISVFEIDNDKVNFVTSRSSVSIPEGGKGNLFLKLNIEPENPITAVVSASGLSVASGASLSFNSSNWDNYQPIVLAAKSDDDCSDSKGTVTITDAIAEVSSIQIGVTKIDTDDDCEVSGGDDDDDAPPSGTVVLKQKIYIEGSVANWNGTRAFWQGIVPVNVTIVGESTEGMVEGGGHLSFGNHYSYLQYSSDGTGDLIKCYFTEYGSLITQITGTRVKYTGVNPRYYLEVELYKDTISREMCSDGSYWQEPKSGLFKDSGLYFDDNSNYFDSYYDQQSHYYSILLGSNP